MRTIGQPNVYSVKLLLDGVIHNAFEVPATDYKKAQEYTVNMCKKLGYSVNDFEILIKRV